MPFPTRVVAEHAKSADDRQAAALLYGTTMTITAILFFSMWFYGSRRLLRPDADYAVSSSFFGRAERSRTASTVARTASVGEPPS